ncbi:hypothetical protein [Anaerocolumna xylanovorans]|uniref:Beta-lactamase n=1 Tax=Anaerocolumna xylanovorans DSM 12503 TaxID=1121345 RepID=A0A1M7Y1J3_9FIRM|nr:hypothetical protein [Anaerocolumna xylanovorans]SHO45497.1 hypothetical protein SAMN02745217_00976 [Anaerocolumna xylanovorans DSM 12503]
MKEELIDADFNGCVSVRKNGRHILNKAFGYADLANKIPNQLTTRFATASAGAFTTVIDIEKFWDALFSYKLLSAKMTGEMLKVHSGNEEEGYYGYGIWLRKEKDDTYSPYFQGCDPGGSFITWYHPAENKNITLVSNLGCNVWKLLRNLKDTI